VRLANEAPNPIDEARRIGTVTVAAPQWVTINLPKAGAEAPFVHYGEIVPRGEVGEYICFPRGEGIVLGRITKVELPERDRLSVEPKIGRPEAVDPIGSVALLTDVDLKKGEVAGAVSVPPRLGTPAYSVSAGFLQWVLESCARKQGEKTPVVFSIGDVAGVTKAPVSVSPERLFGRHCAVLGVTGGGKSWTIARLVEECAKHKCKVVLIDATGEFETLGSTVAHCSIGSDSDGITQVSCPYHKLEERDLFALFTPSGQSQAPMLREAIRSLKLAKCKDLPTGLVMGGCIPKAGRPFEPFHTARLANAATVESVLADFDVSLLPEQISYECIYPPEHNKFGRQNDGQIAYCLSMIMRIVSLLKSVAMAPILQPGKTLAVQEMLEDFVAEPDKRVLRVSLQHLSFALSVRPIVVNAIGRHLLQMARTREFSSRPLVALLDEAHQFLGKSVGDENNSYALDAFDLIAKEGRKFGLTVCLSTQRPRDIQDGVLSQMGTMIVHRLTHGADRDVVERAARDVEKSVAALLPTLGPGQALLLGADFPVPIPIQIRPPTKKPESKGPDYQQHWLSEPLSPAPD
jgi:DNA helicase HerA-like ATPase